MAQDDKFILLRVHAMGALSREGKIEIILDVPPKVSLDLSTQPEDTPDEWAERDADRLKMIVYGYFPDITVDKFEEIVLKRLTTKQIVKELERRTK